MIRETKRLSLRISWSKFNVTYLSIAYTEHILSSYRDSYGIQLIYLHVSFLMGLTRGAVIGHVYISGRGGGDMCYKEILYSVW